MSEAIKGHCQLCGWEGVLTKNGRMRSHKGDPEKGLLENGNCPKGSDFPREALAPVPVTESGGPNPHRAPLAPDAPLSGPLTDEQLEELAEHQATHPEEAGQPPVETYDPNCDVCSTGTHTCPGCGDYVTHQVGTGRRTCDDCTVFYADDPSLEDPRPTAAEVRAAETFMLTAPADVPDGAEESADNVLAMATTYGVRPEPPDPDADAADFFGTDAPSDDDAAADFFDSDEPEQAPSKGRWFPSRYDGSCDTCGGYFMEGDDIRADGEGGWECRDHDEEDTGETPKPARPRQVSPKPPLKAGRYNLPDPVSGKPSKYSRVTTWVKAASDHFSLKAWELRSAIVGMANSPDLVARVVGLDVKADAKALNALADLAKNAAGAKDKANIGTKVHKWTEEVDAGRITLEQVPEEFRDRVGEYRVKLEQSGCTVLPHLIERTTVVLELGVVGTFDQAWLCPDGEYRIVDKKTGAIKYDRLEIEAQLSIYAHGANRYGVAEWDPALGDADDPAAWVWRPLTDNDGNPIKVSETSGIVVHMPQDGSPIQLLGVDLTRGWEHAQLCKRVKESQRTNPAFPPLEFAPSLTAEDDRSRRVDQQVEALKNAGAAMLARVVPPQRPAPVPTDFQAPPQAPEKAPEQPLTWAERFAAVTCREEADAVLKAARDAGMPKERQTQLIAVARQALGKSAA